MENLQVFSNEEFGQIRSILLDGEPWFVAKDVADALGYKESHLAIALHVDDDDRFDAKNSICEVGAQNTPQSTKEIFILDRLGRKKYPVFINESGMYSLILSSKLDSAKKFKRWVTHEVLPAIRQTGLYATDVARKDFAEDPAKFAERMDKLDEVLAVMKGLREEVGLLRDENREIKVLNSRLLSERVGMRQQIASAEKTIEDQARRLRYGAAAMEFTGIYGADNKARPVAFYAQEIGLSAVTMNRVLVSFGILREKRSKEDKNLHRYAQRGWERYVRQTFSYVRVIGTDKKEGYLSLKVNPASPSWLPSALYAFIGFFRSRALLDHDGKFLKDVWEKACAKEKRRCKKEGVTMKQAWALDLFPDNMLPFEDLSIRGEQLSLFPSPPRPQPVFPALAETEEKLGK